MEKIILDNCYGFLSFLLHSKIKSWCEIKKIYISDFFFRFKGTKVFMVSNFKRRGGIWERVTSFLGGSLNWGQQWTWGRDGSKNRKKSADVLYERSLTLAPGGAQHLLSDPQSSWSQQSPSMKHYLRSRCKKGSKGNRKKKLNLARMKKKERGQMCISLHTTESIMTQVCFV